MAQMVGGCIVCGRGPVDRCHIKSKGSGGRNEDWNLVPQCRKHHNEQHATGWIPHIKKYPNVWYHLEERGWVTEVINGIEKLWNPRSRP